MRVKITELMELLGVGYELVPYEAFRCDCSRTGSDKGTMVAEVFMGDGGDEIEAVIHELKSDDENSFPEQLMWLRACLQETDSMWDVKNLKIKGDDQEECMYDWQTKSCKLFGACVAEIMLDQYPDFDVLLKEHMQDKEAFSSGGRGGRKAPKAKMDKVLGMKAGGSF